MIIKKETPCAFIRLNNYNEHSFIEEHNKMIKEKGYTWVLKIGHKLRPYFLEEIVKKNGGIIMKTPAKEGHKFYYCKLTDINPEHVDLYPDYYSEFLTEFGVNIDDTLEIGHWFKIESMELLKEEQVKKFEVISTKKNLLEAGCKFRVVQFYVEPKEDIIID